jgi:hypothetical protein
MSVSIRPQLIYDDIQANVPRDPGARWARVSIRHDGGRQETLSNENGKRMWQRTGFLFIQVFTPQGTGLSTSDLILQAFRDGFQGYASPGGIWFRDVRIEEVGNSGSFFQSNVVARFEYSEIQ